MQRPGQIAMERERLRDSVGGGVDPSAPWGGLACPPQSLLPPHLVNSLTLATRIGRGDPVSRVMLASWLRLAYFLRYCGMPTAAAGWRVERGPEAQRL